MGELLQQAKAFIECVSTGEKAVPSPEKISRLRFPVRFVSALFNFGNDFGEVHLA